jgi:hypothetical protein
VRTVVVLAGICDAILASELIRVVNELPAEAFLQAYGAQMSRRAPKGLAHLVNSILGNL